MPAESPGSLSDLEYELSVRHLLAQLGTGTASTRDLSTITVEPAKQTAQLPDVPWRHFGGELNAARFSRSARPVE